MDDDVLLDNGKSWEESRRTTRILCSFQLAASLSTLKVRAFLLMWLEIQDSSNCLLINYTAFRNHSSLSHPHTTILTHGVQDFASRSSVNQ